MTLRLLLAALIPLAAVIVPAASQTFDSSGNNLLQGAYYFRQVLFDNSGNQFAMFGQMAFTGSGTYTLTGTQAIECSYYGQCGYLTVPAGGTYTISASGHGWISGALTGSPIIGLVGANGVFVGSTTEAAVNDLFIAAPVSGQNTGTLQGPYSLAYIYPGTQVPYDALLTMNANGAGGIATVNVSAYAMSTTPATQSISGVTYRVSNNAFVVTFPDSNSNLLVGDEYLYATPDGSFVFGGSPSDFDMIVGVKTGTGGAGFGGGNYYDAGMLLDNSQLQSTGYSYLSTYYGSLNANNGTIVGHERVQTGSGTASSYTYTSSYPSGTDGSYNDSSTSTQYVGGSGGAVRIGLGLGPYLGISVALQAPAFTPDSGPYLYPSGVVNAASYAPFTAGVTRGELVILAGANLGAGPLRVAPGGPWPTELDKVQVLVNGVAAPLYYVSGTQIAAVVPWEISSSVAQFQVIYNGTGSNTVSELVYKTTPGVFTDPANGIGYAKALHQDGATAVTPSSPAQPGETVSVFLTGLGDVSPGVTDGAPASTTTLSKTSNTIVADIGGTAATVDFAGLAPGLIGLYQVNLTIPATATSGDNSLNISGPDSYASEALITIGSGTSATSGASGSANAVRRAGPAALPRHWHRPSRLPQSAGVPLPGDVESR